MTEQGKNAPAYNLMREADPPYDLPVLRIRDVYPGFRIPDPDFYPSRISDPGSKTATKERGEKKFDVMQFL